MKGDISVLDEVFMTSAAGRDWKGTGGISTSSLSYGHPRRDSP